MDNIKIQIADQFLVLNELQLRFQYFFPYKTGETIQGAASWYFDIPANVPTNQQILEHSFYKSTNHKGDSYRIYTAVVIIHGKALFTGKLTIKNANTKRYYGFVLVNPFPTDFANLPINDPTFTYPTYNLGSTTQDVADYAKAATQQQYPATDFNFPMVHAPAFAEHVEYINTYNITPDNFVDNGITSSRNFENAYRLVPCPYLAAVLNYLFTSIGYNMDGDFVNNSLFKKKLLLSNFGLDFRQQTYFVHAKRENDPNPDFSGVLVFDQEIQDDDNVFAPSGQTYTCNTGWVSVKIIAQFTLTGILGTNTLKADVKLNGLLTPLFTLSIEFLLADGANQTKTGTFEGAEFLVDGDLLTVELSAFGATLDINLDEITIQYSNVSESNLNRWAKSFNLASALPDLTVGEFIRAIRDTFGLALFFDFGKKEVEFAFLDTITKNKKYFEVDVAEIVKDDYDTELSDKKYYSFNFEFTKNDTEGDILAAETDNDFDITVSTYNQLPVADKLGNKALVTNLNRVYSIQTEEATNIIKWLPLYHYQPIQVLGSTQNQKQEVTPKAYPVLMTINADGYALPVTSLVGKSEVYEQAGDSLPLVFMWDHGLFTDGDLNKYHSASSSGINNTGTRTIELDFRWASEFGLLAQQSFFYNFLKNANKLKQKYQLTPQRYFELLQLFSTNAGKHFILDDAYVKFMPDTLSAVIKSDGQRIELEIEMLKENI